MSKRLGKRERALLASKAQSKVASVAYNMRNEPARVDRTLRQSKAYSPSAERLSIYGRCRVMHNATGSQPVKSPFKKRFSLT